MTTMKLYALLTVSAFAALACIAHAKPVQYPVAAHLHDLAEE